ncbi:hypothetical protein [Exiguobacterium sp. K1]|uniref:hypothetical protein n=1 Tax=Exiguobacterium sp. K1 TaxID=2980105 RepID=UPI00299F1F87|nr:hypothetical protein [Exiguobacterium sp. K1]MDX1259019.1 hypothetical protein [Exiguobacterium sp. K1]
MSIRSRSVSLITLISFVLLLLWTTEIISPILFVMGFAPLALAMLGIGIVELREVLRS